jgi:putative selenium metabolism hydrolase
MTEVRLQGLAAEALLSFCQTMVRTPGLPGEEQAVADVVTAQCLRMAFDSIHRDDLGNVIAVREGSPGGPVILFDGHMDVVPVENPDLWKHDPHGAEISEGILWGRGAADTRCALAGMIWAAGSLRQEEIKGKIIVAATVCEENVTGAALWPLLDQYHPDIVVTGEPTGLRLGVAQKGRMTLFLHARGCSAHTSTPEVGENAIEIMMDALKSLRQMDQPEDENFGRSLLVLTEIISEPFPNGFSVPHGCHARLISRILPGESRQSLLKRIQTALNGQSNVHFRLGQLQQTTYTGYKIQVEDFLPGWQNPVEDAWQPKIIAALRKAGLPEKLYYAPCGTNASASAERGISSFIFGPGELSQAHIVDEWVKVDDILSAELGYRTMLNVCANRQNT